MAKVSGTIAGTPIEGYVRFLRRRAHLCSPGQTAILNLDPSYPTDINPSDELVLYENDVLVFTGYVGKATRQKPTFDWIVEGMDTYQRVQATFLDTPMVVGHDPDTEQPIRGYQAQSTDYWIGYILTQCGISYTIQAGNHTVPQGVQLGLRTAHESLQDIMAYSSQYAWVNPSGVLEIKRTVRNSRDYTLTDFLRFEYKKDDEWTRNVIKVYGMNSGVGSRQQKVFASASASVAGIVPDRISAVATPMIQTFPEAQRVADYLLKELGDVTWVATGTIEGNPNIKIGQSAQMIYDDFNRTDVITSLETDWDENGYVMQVTTGERCPRIAGWSKLSPKVYAGTEEDGVYRSTDAGRTWTPFNAGLPTGDKYVTRLAFNSFEEGMSIVNGRIWVVDDFNSSGSWVEVIPPATSSSGSYPQISWYAAVDATGGTKEFDILKVGVVSSGSLTSGSVGFYADGYYRTWNMHYNASSGSTVEWTITPIEDTTVDPSNANVEGMDLLSPYTISRLTTPILVGNGWTLGKGPRLRTRVYWNGFIGLDAGWWSVDAGVSGILDWEFANIQVLQDLSNPLLNTLTFDIKIYLRGGLATDDLFLYGTLLNGLSMAKYQCDNDINGDAFWPVQHNATFVRYSPDFYTSEWIIPGFIININQSQNARKMVFNFFYSSRRGIPPRSSYIMGDGPIGQWYFYTSNRWNPGLVHHLVARSPYGDTQHQGGGRDVSSPYPIRSVLKGGEINFYG